MSAILTKIQMDVLGDLARELHQAVGFKEEAYVLTIIDGFRRAVEPQIIEIRKLRELVKYAGSVLRGDGDAVKFADILDATRDPELMYTR
jgi:hypothetical protein